MATRGQMGDGDRLFAEGLKAARLARDMTQAQIMDAMNERGFGFVQQTVYKIENNMRRVTIGEAMALAEILNTPLEDLVSDPLVALRIEMDQRIAAIEAAAVRVAVARLDFEAAVITANEAEARYRAAVGEVPEGERDREGNGRDTIYRLAIDAAVAEALNGGLRDSEDPLTSAIWPALRHGGARRERGDDGFDQATP